MPDPIKSIHIDLLPYRQQLKIKQENGNTLVWDPIRRKYVSILPEEIVRQCLILFLLDSGYSERLITVEKQFKVGNRIKRYDILVHRKAEEPYILIECKNPDINITQDTFDQISMYNMQLKIPYLLVSNGISSYLCHIDFDEKKYNFIDQLPNTKKNPMSELEWNYSEFLTFVLIHAGYADLELTDSEKDLIQNRFGKETFDKILAEYDTLGDYERLQSIMKYKGVYFPTAERKMEILAEMKKLFDADGFYSKLEVNLMNFLEHML